MSADLDHLVLDIETIPNPDVDVSMIAEQRHYPAPAHCVVAVSIMHITPSKVDVLRSIGSPEDDELELLRDVVKELHDTYAGSKIITWGGRYFDFPVMTWRCMHYGVVAPRLHACVGARFNEWPHLDLVDHMSYFGSTIKPKLLHACQAIGMPGKSGMDGSMVEAAYDSGRINDIRKYCCFDVLQTGIVALRWWMTRGVITQPTHNCLVKSAVQQGEALGLPVKGWAQRLVVGQG